MISPGEHLQWLWGQPALQGQHGVPKYVGEGVPMCSHCQAETGGTLFSVGMVAFVIGGSFPAHRHWLLASAGPPVATCGRRLLPARWPWERPTGTIEKPVQQHLF